MSIESFVASDFKYLIQSMVGSDRPYILSGFDVIQPQDAIDTPTLSIRVANSIVWSPKEGAGSFFYGLPEGNVLAEPLVPELRTNAVNYVYVNLSSQDGVRDSRAFWDPDQNGGAGGEFSQDVDTQSSLIVDINVSVAGFPENSIPVCIVKVGPSSIESIQDARDLMFRLGTGGAAPDPFNSFTFPQLPSPDYARNEPPTTMSAPTAPNAFQGGDKNITSLKEWMDVVMTRIKEVSGDVYWYSGSADNATYSIKSIFNDALGSTMKSKGEWLHDNATPGKVEWTEDIQWKSLIDPRKIIFRNNVSPEYNITLDDGQVAYFKLVRDADFNDISETIEWTFGINYLNGNTGAFVNLSKGDWVKKIDDSDDMHLRVEEFYAGPNMSGGTTTATLAQSVKLSEAYAGLTISARGVFTKGEYQPTDVEIRHTNDSALQSTGDDFFWLVHRSDTTLNVASIENTALDLNITEADGIRAKCTEQVLANHGLLDGDRITITTGGYIGTYIVDVADNTSFYISTAVTGDESNQSAFYAIVNTAQVLSDDGFLEETATHSFEANQNISIAGTSSDYDGEHTINVRSTTSVQIPIGLAVADPGSVGTCSLPRVNVKTEFGLVKVVQGESINIGDSESANILTYLGMPSLAQSTPNYFVPNNYNTLEGFANYNSSTSDDITTRVSKLTAMMADRVQDRGMKVVGPVTIQSTQNSTFQDITASNTVVIKLPSSADQIVDLTCSIPENSMAIAEIDRNAGGAIVLTIESMGSEFVIDENKIILFYRFTGTDVYTWDGATLFNNSRHNTDNPEISGNRNITVFNNNGVKRDISTGEVFFTNNSCGEVTDILCVDGATIINSSAFILNSAKDETEYHVWINVDGTGSDPGDTANPIQVVVSSADTDAQVAAKIANAVTSIIDFNATSDGNVATIVNANPGATTNTVSSLTSPTNLAISTVNEGIDTRIRIKIPGSANDNYVDADTVGSDVVLGEGQAAWVRISRTAEKVFNTAYVGDAPPSIDTDLNGTINVTDISAVPTSQDVFILWYVEDGNILEMNKAELPTDNIYDENLYIVSSAPSTSTEILGPIPAGNDIIMPIDSIAGTSQFYIVGSKQLQVWLNGQYLTAGIDYEEVGIDKCTSNRISMNTDLEPNDIITFRIDTNSYIYFSGGAGGGGGASSLQDAYDGGRFITTVLGAPIIFTGPNTERVFSVDGSMIVTNVIEQSGSLLTPQATSPLIGINAGNGLWVRSSDDRLVYEGGEFESEGLHIIDAINGDSSITSTANGLEIQATSGSIVVHNNIYSPSTLSIGVNDTVDDLFLNSVNLNIVSASETKFKFVGTTGTLEIGNSSTQFTDSSIKLFASSGGTATVGDYIAHKANPDISGSTEYTWSNDGTLDQLLSTDGSGNLTWIDKPSNSTILAEFTNNTGSTIVAGTPVVASKTTAGEVVVADATDVSLADAVIGIIEADILNGGTGNVIMAGVADVVVGSPLTLGERAYISETTGEITSTAPASSGSVIVPVGIAIGPSKIVVNVMSHTVRA